MTEAFTPDAPPPEPRWIANLRDEIADLSGRMDRLDDWLRHLPEESPAWESERVELMLTQMHAMGTLLHVLGLRVREGLSNPGDLVV